MTDTATEHTDIQGIVRGFDKSWPWGRFVMVELSRELEKNRKFLRGLKGILGSTYADGPASIKDLHEDVANMAFDCAYNVAFSFLGMGKLELSRSILESFPNDYAQGMKFRADINGDDDASDPMWWEEHWRKRTADVWIGIYARTGEVREQRFSRLEEYINRSEFEGISKVGCDEAHRFLSGSEQFWIDDESTQPEQGRVMEHFGFQDGISNPAYKGLNDHAREVNGGGKLDKKGRWRPLAAGELLFGYVDEIGEIPAGPTPSTVSYNGTFMVYRKLSQDIDMFRDYLIRMAKKYDDVTADYLAAKMVGRNRNGKSLIKGAPGDEDINNFVYEDDPRGIYCPLGSHARRANPRDTLEFQSLLVDRHRILRRAMPYGRPVDRECKQAQINNMLPLTVGGKIHEFPCQGLIFICLNVDIVRQFEFIQTQWINFGNDLNQGSDRDPIIGNHNDRGRMVFPGKDHQLTVCPNLPRFVDTRGGEYFFLPGIRAYHSIISGGFS